MKRFIKFAFAFLGLILTASSGAKAQGPYYANSCSYADVNDCINGSGANTCHTGGPTGAQGTHTAINGDTINIPACAQTNWTTSLSIKACINLVGAGQSSTILGDNVSKASGGSPMMALNANCPSNIPTVSNLTFQGVATDYQLAIPSVLIEGNLQAFRVHDISVPNDTITPFIEIQVSSGTWGGLIDHLTENGCGAYGQESGGIFVESDGWNGENYGDGSWAASDSTVPGMWNAVYIENSTFNCNPSMYITTLVDAYSGAHYVFRFNTTSFANTGGHGTDTSQRHRGMRWQEVYMNTYSFPSGYDEYPAYLHWTRGGSSVMFGNQITAPGGIGNLMYAENCRDGTGCGSSYAVWGFCNGSTVYDENHLTTGWLCADQPGAGQSLNLNGATTPPSAWVGNDQLPIYTWLNTVNNSDFETTGTSTNVAQNRDFYNYTASFNGTSGVGSGTYASMPSTCTTGVAYWATDKGGSWNKSGGTSGYGVAYSGQGALYKCTATNTWTLYYTPYTYPHPLASELGPPSGLQGTVN